MKDKILEKIERILKKDPSKMFSREEIINLISEDSDAVEHVLAELEVASSMKESRPDVYATCMAGTVYYKWNRPANQDA